MTPEKREKLLNIYDESFLHVVGSTDNFVRFLEQISYLHKYSIDEQLCIHGQMPEAKHLADFDTWVKLGRFVKRGQKAVSIPFGEYRGLTLHVRKNFHEYGNVDLRIVRKANYVVTNSLGNGLGGIRKIENETQRIPKYLEDNVERLTTVEDQFIKATERQAGTFPQEKELNEKIALQAKLNQEIQISLEQDKSKSTRKEQLIEQIDQVEIGY
ncbi:hypothetical protein ACFJYX_11660 [Enterococcus faecalis]